MTNLYINPTEDAGRKLFSKSPSSPVIMLNLLKFREHADYHNFPELAPKQQISGREAFEKYIELSQPFLKEAGGEILLIGDSKEFFIGPQEETWDMVMMIRQRSLNDFLSFATNQDYLKTLGHREAALLDSRLLPVFERKIKA